MDELTAACWPPPPPPPPPAATAVTTAAASPRLAPCPERRGPGAWCGGSRPRTGQHQSPGRSSGRCCGRTNRWPTRGGHRPRRAPPPRGFHWYAPSHPRKHSTCTGTQAHTKAHTSVREHTHACTEALPCASWWSVAKYLAAQAVQQRVELPFSSTEFQTHLCSVLLFNICPHRSHSHHADTSA